MLVSVLHFLWLNYIPLYGHITFYFSIHHLVNTCVVSNFCFLYIMLLWTFICKYLHEFMFSFFLEMKVLGHMGTLGFHVWGTADMFSKAVATTLHSHQCVWGFQFLYIFISTFQYLCFDFSYPSGCKVISHVVLICISLMTSNVEHFSWGYGSFLLFEKCLFKIDLINIAEGEPKRLEKLNVTHKWVCGTERWQMLVVVTSECGVPWTEREVGE